MLFEGINAKHRINGVLKHYNTNSHFASKDTAELMMFHSIWVRAPESINLSISYLCYLGPNILLGAGVCNTLSSCLPTSKKICLGPERGGNGWFVDLNLKIIHLLSVVFFWLVFPLVPLNWVWYLVTVWTDACSLVYQFWTLLMFSYPCHTFEYQKSAGTL